MKKFVNGFQIVFVLIFLSSLSSFFVSCTNANDESTPTQKADDYFQIDTSSQENNPEPFSTRNENLDFIFDTKTVGKTLITIDREQWETLCTNFDTYPKNEEYVHADYSFERTVDGKKESWAFKDVGFRLRGNTSRCRPQKETGEYVQAHFKVDFEEFLDGVDADGNELERKMAGCMKGVNLKRFKEDAMYVREIFCYNFFRDNGIWTSPRASYTQLQINIRESDKVVTKINYGVYAMIENIDKQFLKARTKGDKGKKFNDNKGNLWKCLYTGTGPADLVDTNDNKFGVEEVGMSASESNFYTYDLKTNKDDLGLSSAKTEFKSFITGLNALDANSAKTWFESKMDVDLFIKTYAINVILGMDDDYWRNSNNYYFYFDGNAKDGTKGLAYFIPYDYDNSLGTNCFEDTVTKDPMKWGNGNAPLIEKLFLVDEYKTKYQNYLKNLTSAESNFVDESKTKIQTWQNLIKQSIKSDDLSYTDTTDHFVDTPASWCSNREKYFLLQGDNTTNYFSAKAAAIRK